MDGVVRARTRHVIPERKSARLARAGIHAATAALASADLGDRQSLAALLAMMNDRFTGVAGNPGARFISPFRTTAAKTW
ncbi:hypothetical protein AOC05_11930 [Arthrobacter alpinus]|uniref:Uncharacterized protein n=1 Tax=Arthrobacter alpinus TaxID=656366 RepID=A0A0M5LXT1_9MICC|nr:hypothetical protein [Arthrobacter sp. AQ5-05]ALE92837.1 hypothetical protein AOC05_11930 [Arthrobacter alpinus]